MKRCVHLVADCTSCGWMHYESVLAKPERVQVADYVIRGVHEYECPAKPARVLIRAWNGELPLYQTDPYPPD